MNAGHILQYLRSDIAAETRAKMVYEYLLQFTDDPYVKDTLYFLMTREVAHFQMFEAALDTIKPNFPPGILQADPRYSNLFFNMSSGNDYQGPWNQGNSTRLNEPFQYIEDPVAHVMKTNGLVNQKPKGAEYTPAQVEKMNKKLGKERSTEVNKATAVKNGVIAWNDADTDLKNDAKGASDKK